MQNLQNHENQMSTRSELFSDELEKKLIGIAFAKPEVVDYWVALKPEHFYFPAHAAIFQKLREMRYSGQEISPITFTVDFENTKKFDDFGGVKKYLIGCVSLAVSDFTANDHRALAQRITDLYRRRELTEIAKSALESVGNLDNPLDKEIENLTAYISQLQRSNVNKGFRDEKEIAESILQAMKDSRLPYGTGIAKLDEAMDGGLYPGKSYGFAARKKVGKTIMAGTISHNLSLHGVKHLFICGEMSPEEIHQRTIARRLNAFPSAFRSGYGKSDDFQRKLAIEAVTSQRNTIYFNAPGLTFNELRSICIAAVNQKNISGLILDYWQLVGGKDHKKSTAEHLDEVAQWLADFCRKNGIWSICMAQINQEGNTRGGEGLRLAFDQVYQIHREDLTAGTAWLEMLDTRYTRWFNIGDKETPGLILNEHGPFFEQAA